MRAIKIIVAVFCVIFFLALGAFGGCLAGLAGHGGDLFVIGTIGGGAAGLWAGILIAQKILTKKELPGQNSKQDSNDPNQDSMF